MDLDVLRLGIHSQGHRGPRVIAVSLADSQERVLPGTPAFSPVAQAFCLDSLLSPARLEHSQNCPTYRWKNCSRWKSEHYLSAGQALLRGGLDAPQDQARSPEKGNQCSLTRPCRRAGLSGKSCPRRKSK